MSVEARRSQHNLRPRTTRHESLTANQIAHRNPVSFQALRGNYRLPDPSHVRFRPRPPRRRHGPCPEPSSSPSALVYPPLFPPLSYFGISSHHGQRTPPILHISPLSSEHSKFPSRSQGAKAAQKRERNASKGANAAKSQTKTNEAAKNIICVTCRQTFVRPPLSHSLPLRPDPQPSS